MVDPILDEELKRHRRMKQYQKYQNHLDQIDKVEKKEEKVSIGNLMGKKVKAKISSEESSLRDVFKRTHNIKNKI